MVKLTAEEQAELEVVVKKGKAAAWKRQLAQSLLKCDQADGGPAWIDQDIADAFGCSRQSVENWRKQQEHTATVTAVAPPGRFGLLDCEGDAVTQFVEKPVGDGGLINGGFFVLAPSALDYVTGDDTVWEQAPLRQLAAEGQLSANRIPYKKDERQCQLWYPPCGWCLWPLRDRVRGSGSSSVPAASS